LKNPKQQPDINCLQSQESISRSFTKSEIKLEHSTILRKQAFYIVIQILKLEWEVVLNSGVWIETRVQTYFKNSAVVFLSKKLYPYCSVLVNFRNKLV